jgi:hypothetical protein
MLPEPLRVDVSNVRTARVTVSSDGAPSPSICC